MLRLETVSPELVSVLKTVQSFKSLKNFRLVGGTALALQIGHRQSIDIDLFTDRSFDKEIVKREFREVFKKMELISDLSYGFSCIISDIKVDVYNWGVSFLRPAINFGGIKMASTDDIAAFKLHTIEDRGAKKDYWDLAHLLEKYSLKEMITFYKLKYESDDKQLMSRLLKFERAEEDMDPKTFTDFTWEKIKQKISDSFYSLVEEQKNNKK